MSVFVRHGFQDLAERTKLSRFASLAKVLHVDANKYSIAERLRLSFEELGPTFVKLGQLLSTRPDLIPYDVCEEFKKLQDQVKPMQLSEVERVLEKHFGTDWKDVFTEFDPEPLGAASIAQVHSATLKDGRGVVVKVQRPGLESIIREDLSILYTIADLLEKYVEETRLLNLNGIVDEFARTLDLETNFVIEANNIRRFIDNFANEPNIKIPEVYTDFSGKNVLVLEKLEGIPLSHKSSLTQEGINPEAVLRTGLRCYLKMVFTDGLFHGDLHAGNMFVLPNNRIGLVDFGVVGRLNRRTQSAIANMLVALANEDYDRLAYEYMDLAPYTESVDIDLFARDLRDLIAPYYGLTLKHVNVGRLLMESAAVASKYRLQLPSELIMFFKSILTIEGMGRLIMKDFNFLAYSLEFAAELVSSRTEPTKILKDLSSVGRDFNALMANLPRQLRQLMRRFTSPDFAIKLDIQEAEKFRKATLSAAQMVFLGLLISSLVLSATLLYIWGQQPVWYSIPLMTAGNYAIAFILFIYALSRK